MGINMNVSYKNPIPHRVTVGDRKSTRTGLVVPSKRTGVDLLCGCFSSGQKIDLGGL